MQSQFLHIDRLLTQTVFFWQFSAFHCADYPWRESHPALIEWLESLSLEEIGHLKNTPLALALALSHYIPEVTELSHFTQFPLLAAPSQCIPKGFNSGINGRKWQQITNLSALSSDFYSPESEWLEWCGGKGYLGRVLSSTTNKKVTTLEWQQELCDSGQHYADGHSLSMRFIQGDALSKQAYSLIKPQQHAVALHACGDLHLSLIEAGIKNNIEALTIAPCCFHLTENEEYRPLSFSAQDSLLRLSRVDLRLPLQETVVAGKRTQHHREQEMCFRLGFNELQKWVTGSSEYITVPSIKKSRLAEGFEAFCHWAAAHKGIKLVDNIDYSIWLEKGEAAFILMEKCDLVQHLFKRPLEMWLCFDRALYLEESGYEVRIGEFCLKEETPRNIVIQAKLG